MPDIQADGLDTQIEFPKICLLCKENNLTQSIREFIHTCPRCGTIFCTHFASSIDPDYCKDCCKDVEMTEATETVTREKFNIDTDTSTITTHKYKSIKFNGLDWLFFQRKISTLTDEELSLAIEYHYNLYRGMLAERDKRRVEKAHRYAGKQFKITNSAGESLTTISTEVTVKKSRTVKPKEKSAAEINALAGIQSLLSKGMNLGDILSAMKKVK